jgi:hypothetical protein
VTRRKFYIDKRCGSKNVKKPNEKKGFRSRTKDQKLGSPKNKRAKKT